MNLTIESEIGIIPSDAKIISLGDCISAIIDHRGKTPKKLDSDWVKTGVPAISAKNIHNGILDNLSSIRYVTQEVYEKWMKDDVVKGDCFLVSEGATLGEILYWDFDYPIVLSQRLFCIRTNPNLLYSKYFYAYMNTSNFQRQVEGRATGSSVDGLRQTEVLKLQIPVIPIERQIFIGDLLYNLEKKQKELQKQNQTLETIAQTIFKEWFGKYQVDDELPEGWRVGKLGEVIEFINGYAFKSKDLSKEPIDNAYKVFKMGDIRKGGGFNPNKTKGYFTKSSSEKLKKYILKNGDLLMSMTDMKDAISLLGHTALMIYDDEYIVNQRVGLIRAKNNVNIEYPYLYLLTNNDDFIANLRAGANSGVQVNLSTQGIKDTEFVIADEETNMSFNKVVMPLFEKIKVNTEQIQSLTKTRDTLLPKLMSGQVRVKM